MPKKKHKSKDTVHQGGYKETLHLLQIELFPFEDACLTQGIIAP